MDAGKNASNGSVPPAGAAVVQESSPDDDASPEPTPRMTRSAHAVAGSSLWGIWNTASTVKASSHSNSHNNSHNSSSSSNSSSSRSVTTQSAAQLRAHTTATGTTLAADAAAATSVELMRSGALPSERRDEFWSCSACDRFNLHQRSHCTGCGQPRGMDWESLPSKAEEADTLRDSGPGGTENGPAVSDVAADVKSEEAGDGASVGAPRQRAPKPVSLVSTLRKVEWVGIDLLNEKVVWVQCDDCGQWASVETDCDVPQSDAPWTCRENTWNPNMAFCMPQAEFHARYAIRHALLHMGPDSQCLRQRRTEDD